MPTTEFIFTEKEFKSLPIQIKANDFSLGHCDEHMNTKKEICRIAGIYEKTFSEIMKIFDTRDQTPSEWDNMIKNQNAKISQNLINTAM
jgi:mevalonate kinase